jgi:hypothetical protein
MRIDLSKTVGMEVLALLTQAGHQAYVVGGPVRNALLGARVSDLDVATDAKPERVMALAEAAGSIMELSPLSSPALGSRSQLSAAMWRLTGGARLWRSRILSRMMRDGATSR